jgi:hypothetical protein
MDPRPVAGPDRASRHRTDGFLGLSDAEERNERLALWGVGPVVQIPTISSADLGSNVWGGGPTAIVVHTGDKIVGGALVSAIWSFGGTKGLNSYNTSIFEPFIN